MEPLAETAQPIELEQVAADDAVEDDGVDLENPELYFNRELSWLDFNDRVLQLAEDASVPLLERVKFAAIWESNMDEEFMVRVANLQDMIESGTQTKAADGMSPAEILAAIRTRVLDQRARAGRTFERELRPALAEHGIRILTPDQASSAEREELADLFERQVFPVLTPLVIGRGRPFPYISNLSLSLAVVLRDPEKDNEILARVKVPKELLRRFIAVGDGGAHPGAARRPDRRQSRFPLPRDGGGSTRRCSASPAIRTTTSPTRRTTCCRRSRRSFAGGASARWCGSRSTPG